MEKKVVKLSLTDQLSELESKEQTPEVMAEIDNIKTQIEEETAKEKALEEEIAKNKSEKEAKAKEKADKKAAEEAAKRLPAFTHEEWRIDVFHDPIMEDGKQVVKADGSLAYKTRTVRDKLLKRVIIDPEHADILNNQMLNTKKEYVPITK